MKKYLLSLIGIFIFSWGVFAQAAKPTPPQNDDDPIVVINTDLIQIDVTVTDKKGNIVKDLKAEDFEIYENKDKQQITNFSFIENQAKPKTSPTPAAIAKGPQAIPIPPARLRAENIRRTVAIVVDDLNLSFQSIAYVRQALKNFVNNQMQDGDLVAIIRTGGGVGALQQFTSDKRMLNAAIEKVRWNAGGNGKIGVFSPIEPTFADFMRNSNPNMSDEAYREAKGREREEAGSRSASFAAGTLGALNYIVKGMRELPGRKSVMLMSEGFIQIETDRNGFKGVNPIAQALSSIVELANRSSVVFYTMDPRGLPITGITAADDVSGMTYEQVNQQLSDRNEELAETQATLKTIARETGGLAIINNNDLKGGIQKMLNDQSGYYLIGYQPDGDTFDPKTRRYNKLIVRIKNPDLKIRYRSGFFGIKDDEVKIPADAKKTPQQQIVNAIMSPFAQNGITLSLNSLFGYDQKAGNFIRSFLHIDTSNLKFREEADGSYSAKFDVVAMAFGDNGVVVEQLGKMHELNLKKEGYKLAMDKGIVYNFIFPIKKAGAYQMRVAFRDHATEKIGSASQFIEVPNIKKNRLTLSGLILENLTPEQWKNDQAGKASEDQSDPLADTSVRRFKRGTVLRYAFEIYNSIPDPANRKPKLIKQLRLFRDGELILEGEPSAIDFSGLPASEKISSSGAFALSSGIKTGDYIMQIIVTDTLAKENRKIATQFIQFEVIE